jgi:hypothetical protein
MRGIIRPKRRFTRRPLGRSIIKLESFSIVMEQFVKDNFTLLIFASIGTTIIGAFASVIYRAVKEKGVLSIPRQDLLFSERWASGASQKNLLTRLGAASNCLSVTLGRNALIIRPMFPFNLMFFPEVYDLEHVIQRSALKNIERNGTNGILIEFESDGAMKRFELALRRREEFLRAIEPYLSRGIQQPLGGRLAGSGPLC